MSEIKIEKLIANREKIQKLFKIQLIHDSKWKSNDTRQKIKRKTHNLTRNHARNNPIDHRIKSFSFCISKNKYSAFKR